MFIIENNKIIINYSDLYNYIIKETINHVECYEEVSNYLYKFDEYFMTTPVLKGESVCIYMRDYDACHDIDEHDLVTKRYING